MRCLCMFTRWLLFGGPELIMLEREEGDDGIKKFVSFLCRCSMSLINFLDLDPSMCWVSGEFESWSIHLSNQISPVWWWWQRGNPARLDNFITSETSRSVGVGGLWIDKRPVVSRIVSDTAAGKCFVPLLTRLNGKIIYLCWMRFQFISSDSGPASKPDGGRKYYYSFSSKTKSFLTV